MNSHTLPAVFVWEKCLGYFGQAELAKTTLADYKQQLIETRQELKTAVQEQNLQRISYLFIYLLGAASYCGTPRLHKILRHQVVNSDQLSAHTSVNKVNDEIELALSAISQFLQDSA